MNIKINVFDPASIDSAIKQLEDYEKRLDQKAKELCERLAQMGALYAEWNFSGVLYAGDIDCHVDVQQLNPNTYAVIAYGETVLLLEFGAGVRHGYGHPKANELGMGPGTYPGQKHAMDPKGWWFPYAGNTERGPNSSAGYMHTYGNAPGMAMYNAGKDLKNEILQVAREVFGTL